MSQPEVTVLLPGFDPAGERIPDENQSNRVARLINGVARITGNVAEATKKNEGALNHEVYTTLLEAARKATPQTSSKRKVTTEEASKSKKRKEAQDIQQYIPQGLSEENATLSSVEEGVAQLSHAPPTTSRSTKRPPTSMYLSPCTGGKEWQATWAAIVKKQPIIKVTNKPFVWLDNLTKVLVFMWGSPQGVNFVMRMVEVVYRDFDNLTLDAITSVGSPRSSVHTLEMRYKRVLALSTAPALQSTELLCEYKRMADDFIWLEQQTQDPSTELGKEWAKREIDPKKETTDQARSNVVMQEVFKSMHPEEMAKDEREAEIAKLRKMREYARNIATMIAIFGWGVVPLLACAPWKQVFADVSNASAQACLQELANAVPVLRQVCDRLDKNFYRFLRIPGQITQLPKYCLQGMSVKKQDRLRYTIAYHLAAPGEREELGGMLNAQSSSHAG